MCWRNKDEEDVIFFLGFYWNRYKEVIVVWNNELSN